MLFYNHILLGIISFLIFKDFFVGGNEILFFFFVLLGSILPDIDGESKVNRWSGFVGIIVKKISKHRGFFHSVFFFLFLSVVMNLFLGNYFAWGLLIGYFSHLFGDAITRMGVRPFYPLSYFKIKGPLKVGSFMEEIILLVLFCVVLLKVFS